MTTHHIVPVKVYILVFAALMVLTVVTVAAARVDLGAYNTLIALGIAGGKATLVTLYFMHVRYSKRLIWLVLFVGIVFLGILLGMTLTDFLSRGWLPGPAGWE